MFRFVFTVFVFWHQNTKNLKRTRNTESAVRFLTNEVCVFSRETRIDFDKVDKLLERHVLFFVYFLIKPNLQGIQSHTFFFLISFAINPPLGFQFHFLVLIGSCLGGARAARPPPVFVTGASPQGNRAGGGARATVICEFPRFPSTHRTLFPGARSPNFMIKRKKKKTLSLF